MHRMSEARRPGERRALCGICPAGCWVLVTCDERGRIAAVRADPDSELGMICKLGEHAPEIVYSKDRILHPLLRTGPKGSYDFRAISWDEAYERIVERMETIKAEDGPEATSIYTGRGSFELAVCDIFQPEGVAVSSASSVLFPFGSPNTMGVGALCYVAFAMIAPHVTLGGMLVNMLSDIEQSDLVVIWGANPATDCPPLDLERVLRAHERGAEIVVIDPRRTFPARLPGATWVPVRPGTDGALALGLCQVLLDEELHDEAFGRDWTLGLEAFASYVQHFRPEVVEGITGVPAEQVVRLARRIAGAHGAAPVMYSGLEYSEGGVQAIRATLVLWALAGQLDVPGGRCFTMRENAFPLNRRGHIPNPDVGRALGRDRFPIYSAYRGESHAIALPDSVLRGTPYRIRSLLVVGGSMITAWPEPRIWRETLGALDFLVCVDRQMTADAAYADIVLPATTMYEIESYMTYGPVFRIREKVIEPLGEARSDFFILAELAERLGYGHLYPQSEEALLRQVLEGSGFTLEDVRAAGGAVQSPTTMMQYKKWEKGLLRPDGKPGFDTPSGKLEIASSILEEHGYDPLPVYTEPGESPRSMPSAARRYPLVFNSGSRVTTDFRSQHHGVPGLLAERPEPTVTLHTEDAAERGIADGDPVLLRSARGEVPLRAHVTRDIRKGCVDANMGGGGPVGPEAWQRCNINELTDLGRYDPISGFPVYKALLCEVEKAAGGTAAVRVGSGEYESAGDEEDRAAAVPAPDLPRIYLDHNATTPLHPEVMEVMQAVMRDGYGNPSSIYAEGQAARRTLEDARRSLARLLNCTARRVVFTGCGSEANNQVLKTPAFLAPDGSGHVITSAVEHPSVLGPSSWLEERGFEVTRLPVDRHGRVSPAHLEQALTERTLLVSVMLANNETGALQPVAELAHAARRHGVPFHTDATQAIGKIPVDVEALGVDLLTLSGHKLHGPKGVGALYVRRGTPLAPLLHGGSQEGGLRCGTENLVGIAGLGKAAELAFQRQGRMEGVRKLRDRLEAGIRELLPQARRNGHPEERLPNTLNMTLPGYRGESIVLALDRQGVALSSGSACRSGSPQPSHALLAMGCSEDDAHCAVRLSLGWNNTAQEIERTVELLGRILEDERGAVRFLPCR